jgi:hypothetical protein
MKFEERTRHEQGFSRVFEKRIRPAMAELAAAQQSLRERRHRTMKWLALPILAALGVIGASFGRALKPVPGLWEPALILLAWVALLAAFPTLLVIWGRPQKVGDNTARRRLIPIIADHLGVTYDRDASDPLEASAFGKRGLITRANFGSFEDAVTARAGGTSVTMLIADFGRAGDVKAADWKGLLLQGELTEPAPAATRIGGTEEWRLEDGFIPVPGLPGSVPATAAEAPDSVANWIPPALLERLQALRERFDPDDTGRLRTMIDGASLRLSIRNPAAPVLPMPDPLEGADAAVPVLHTLIADAALPLDIAEAFESLSQPDA